MSYTINFCYCCFFFVSANALDNTRYETGRSDLFLIFLIHTFDSWHQVHIIDFGLKFFQHFSSYKKTTNTKKNHLDSQERANHVPLFHYYFSHRNCLWYLENTIHTHTSFALTEQWTIFTINMLFAICTKIVDAHKIIVTFDKRKLFNLNIFVFFKSVSSQCCIVKINTWAYYTNVSIMEH